LPDLRGKNRFEEEEKGESDSCVILDAAHDFLGRLQTIRSILKSLKTISMDSRWYLSFINANYCELETVS
jgi:hypothetical protein